MDDKTFRIQKYKFNQEAVNDLGASDTREENWPVVYQIHNQDSIYVGETTNLKRRMLQHLASKDKECLQNAGNIRAVFDQKFNKSAALDLESFLIQYLSGDGKYEVKNRNDGLRDRDYYNRAEYYRTFEKIWEELRQAGIAEHTLAEINNSELFKFSPYKNLNPEQLGVVTEVLENLDEAISEGRKSLSVIEGDAGTGKTIVIMYLVKLLADLQNYNGANEDLDDESNFGAFFELKQINERFKHKKIALVIPQESLHGRIQKIFNKVDLGDTKVQILKPIAFGQSDEHFDITLVDEAHLLKIGENGLVAGKMREINHKLFGKSDEIHTELDWIMAKSDHVIMVYSAEQRIRHINIERRDIEKYSGEFDLKRYQLRSQMRSRGGVKYIDYIQNVFSNHNQIIQKETFEGFDVKLFTNFRAFVETMGQKEREYGLARMVAGFAWPWRSDKDKDAYDIMIDGVSLRWNSTRNNWIGSENAPNEVGSIYTVQGDDINYVGVIIGEDLLYRDGRLVYNPKSYADSGAKNRNKRQVESGEQLDEDDMLEQILRVYRILLNRAVMGAYIYVCDDELREYLAQYFDEVE